MENNKIHRFPLKVSLRVYNLSGEQGIFNRTVDKGFIFKSKDCFGKLIKELDKYLGVSATPIEGILSVEVCLRTSDDKVHLAIYGRGWSDEYNFQSLQKLLDFLGSFK